MSPIAERLPLAAITRVTFYKRDELTTDLVCCDIEVDGRVIVHHEEQSEWQAVLNHLSALPGFRQEWQAEVMLPPFAACETVAYRRIGGL